LYYLFISFALNKPKEVAHSSENLLLGHRRQSRLLCAARQLFLFLRFLEAFLWHFKQVCPIGGPFCLSAVLPFDFSQRAHLRPPTFEE